ncbi:MAG: hypothetical protein C0521_10290 [Xanthomonas sp.]|nr:hypothetical protein [Xanthomonas sp.]MBL8257535.1 hypothetical protein [Pseudoxanthomonas mexicana]
MAAFQQRRSIIKGDEVGPCYSCGTTVAFGGVKDQGFVFCNKQCHVRKAHFLRDIAAVPDKDATAEAQRIKAGRCHHCGKNGGVDIHRSVFVWSAILITRTQENKLIGCSGCARKKQALDTLGTVALGWWGIPFGLILTPLGLLMNLGQMISSSTKEQPSKYLTQYARERLARSAPRS